MKLLAIGDIFGRPGRVALTELLPALVAEHKIDFTVVNIENASGGRGINLKALHELSTLPIDAMTSGNHIWDQPEIFQQFDNFPLLRPLNLVSGLPGRAWLVKESRSGARVAVLNMQGEIFMQGKGPVVKSPFLFFDEVYQELTRRADIVVVDFHAEATSEKRAFAWHVDGRVSAVWGTHTHVQTADEHVMPDGTAYISDLGMTGPHLSIIGLNKTEVLRRFVEGKRGKFEVAKEGVRLEGVIIDIDEVTAKARSIQRLQIPFPNTK